MNHFKNLISACSWSYDFPNIFICLDCAADAMSADLMPCCQQYVNRSMIITEAGGRTIMRGEPVRTKLHMSNHVKMLGIIIIIIISCTIIQKHKQSKTIREHHRKSKKNGSRWCSSMQALKNSFAVILVVC